ncbi:TetR/AcrR family transcriptional regulator [Pendulispora albinea]|uniref:TetR/AcrR family transcriptional regulator n=1 Tax=Pendulispora albinea TaxID=2741071 RepID=A0ABZ2M1R2_9BACT
MSTKILTAVLSAEYGQWRASLRDVTFSGRFCMMFDIQMGHSQAEKAENHDRILRIAAARFREKGIEGLSVADLMKEAGLTHGGFYRHFASREDLVAEAIAYALTDGETQGGLEELSADNVTFTTLIDAYLNETHRDSPAQGCAVAALAGDVARSGARTRAVFTRQVKRNIQSLSAMLANGDAPSKRAHAILIWSALVGSLTLARAVNDKKLSAEILETVRVGMKSLFGNPKGKK